MKAQRYTLRKNTVKNVVKLIANLFLGIAFCAVLTRQPLSYQRRYDFEHNFIEQVLGKSKKLLEEPIRNALQILKALAQSFRITHLGKDDVLHF